MLWLVCGADTHPSGFAFAIVRGEAVLAWCKREEDAQAIVEAHEAAPEIADLAESGLDWLDEGKRRRVRALVTRVGEKLPEWKCLRPHEHPEGFGWAIVDGAERVAYVATARLAGFVVELSTTVPALSAVTRAAAARTDEGWAAQDTAVVKTLARRLRRRLAEIES